MSIRPTSAAAAMSPAAVPAAGQAQAEGGRRGHDGAPAVRMARVPLRTGVELHVAEAGPADGAPVLFLHGIIDSWFSFSPVLERLPAGIRAIVPTQRGHGDSARPECCYRMADFAADVVALLDALGIERADLVGHSMGSFVAQHVAAASPERVRRLVLIGSSTTSRTEPLVEVGAQVRAFRDAIPADFVHEFQASTAVEPLRPDFLAAAVAESLKAPAWVWRVAFDGLLAADAVPDPRWIQAPTLLVWGEADGLFGRAEQDGLLASIRGARLIVYAETGHAPHWERPDRFVADLQAFLGAPAAD